MIFAEFVERVPEREGGRQVTPHLTTWSSEWSWYSTLGHCPNGNIWVISDLPWMVEGTPYCVLSWAAQVCVRPCTWDVCVCVRLCARTASVPHSHRLNGMLLNRVTEAINRPDIWLVMVCKVCMPVCVCVCVCVCVWAKGIVQSPLSHVTLHCLGNRRGEFL